MKQNKNYNSYTSKWLGFIMLLAAFLFPVNQLIAQDDWETEGGEIEDVEILIEKDKKLTLNEASRLYEKVTPAPLDTAKTAQKLSLIHI